MRAVAFEIRFDEIRILRNLGSLLVRKWNFLPFSSSIESKVFLFFFFFLRCQSVHRGAIEWIKVQSKTKTLAIKANKQAKAKLIPQDLKGLHFLSKLLVQALSTRKLLGKE